MYYELYFNLCDCTIAVNLVGVIDLGLEIGVFTGLRNTTKFLNVDSILHFVRIHNYSFDLIAKKSIDLSIIFGTTKKAILETKYAQGALLEKTCHSMLGVTFGLLNLRALTLMDFDFLSKKAIEHTIGIEAELQRSKIRYLLMNTCLIEKGVTHLEIGMELVA